MTEIETSLFMPHLWETDKPLADVDMLTVHLLLIPMRWMAQFDHPAPLPPTHTDDTKKFIKNA